MKKRVLRELIKKRNEGKLGIRVEDTPKPKKTTKKTKEEE